MNWLYWIFGKILFGIDWAVFHLFSIHNTGLCIIILTLVIYLLMYPLNAKQQKNSRLMNKINPEVKKIQDKYKGKKDQASQLKMNEETQALYAKYGISMFGGCLPLLITMPILWCLYRVMMNMPDYVETLKYVEGVAATPGSPGYFLGLDINVSPMQFFRDPNHPYGWIAFIIPVLATLLQFLNTKLIQANTNGNVNEQQEAMAQSMKTMNYFMPIMSGFFCLSLNMGIGLYWIVGSLFRIIQCIIINRQVDSISLEELIEKNKEKAAKKTAQMEERNRQMQEYAKTKTSSIKSNSSYQNKATDSSTDDNSSRETYSTGKNGSSKPGSISDYANMLSKKDGGKK